MTITAPVGTRKGFRFGLVALIFSIAAPAWTILAILFVITAPGHDLPGQQVETEPTALEVLRYLFVLFAYVVVPVLLILSLVFGIVAMLRNRRRGVIMAAAAFGVLLLGVVGMIAILIASLS
jgi:hypothetical protein